MTPAPIVTSIFNAYFKHTKYFSFYSKLFSQEKKSLKRKALAKEKKITNLPRNKCQFLKIECCVCTAQGATCCGLATPTPTATPTCPFIVGAVAVVDHKAIQWLKHNAKCSINEFFRPFNERTMEP